jgi:hypothetical protein
LFSLVDIFGFRLSGIPGKANLLAEPPDMPVFDSGGEPASSSARRRPPVQTVPRRLSTLG